MKGLLQAIVWDNKSDQNDLKRIEKQISDEVRKMNVQVEKMNKRSEELQENIKTSSKKQDEDLQSHSNKMAFQAMENKFLKKEEMKTLENNLLGNVSKIEKRMSTIETTGKEASSRVTDLERKHSESNEKLVNLSNLKTKFDTFLRESKTESEQVNEQLSRVKKEVSALEEKQKELKREEIKKGENVSSQNFENKTKESLAKIEEKMTGLERSKRDTESKVTDLTKKMSSLNGLASQTELAAITSKLERKAEITDLKSLDLTSTEETKKRKDEIQKIVEQQKALENKFDHLKTESSSPSLQKVESVEENVGRLENRVAVIETFKKKAESNLEDLLKLPGDVEKVKSVKVEKSDLEKLDRFTRDQVEKMKKDIQFSLDRNDEMNQKISSFSQNNDGKSSKDITNKLSDQEDSLKRSLDRIDELQNKINRTSSDVQSLTSKSSVWDAKVDSDETDKLKIKLTGDIEKLNDKLREVDERFATLKTDIEVRSKHSDSTEQNKLTENLNSLKTELKNNISSLTERCSSLQTKTDKLENFVGKVDKKTEQLDSCVTKPELVNVDKMVKDELKKINSSLEYVLNRSDELSSKANDSASKSFESDISETISKINSKTAEIEKKQEEFKKKSDVWEAKADKTELNKMKTDIMSECEKIGDQLASLKLESDSINLAVKSLTSPKEESDKDETISKSVEAKLTSNLAQLENKIAIHEASRKEITNKLSDLSQKQQKINEEFGCISELKAKFNCKSEVWDAKADIKNVDNLIQVQVKKLEKDHEFVLNKADNIDCDVRNLKEKLSAFENISSYEGKIDKIEEQVKAVEVFQKETNGSLSSEVNALREKLNAGDRLESIKVDLNSVKETLATVDIKHINEKIKTIDKIDVLSRDVQNLSDKMKSEAQPVNSKLRSLEEKVEGLNLLQLEEEVRSLALTSKDMKTQVSAEINSLLSREILKVNEKISSLDTKQRDQDSVMSNKDKDSMESSLKALEDEVKSDRETLGDIENKLNSIDVMNLLTKGELNSYLRKEEADSFVRKDEHGADVKQIKSLLTDQISEVKKTVESSSSRSEDAELKKHFISKADFTVLDINHSKLSELVEHIQGEMVTYQNDANSQLEQLEADMNNVKTLVETAKNDSKHSGNI